MGSICLSSASILRCDSLTRNQNIFLIIPTALEVIFSTSLAFIDQGPGKRNLLLTAEGLSFLTLAVLELLSQTLPAVQGNLHLFNAFDLAIGITSFLPISLYTIFLYLLTNAEIVSALPRRIKNLTILTPILFILVIIVFNEIAAFTGVSIQKIPTRKAPKTIVAVGSSGSSQSQLWTISTSLTLAFLTGLQTAVFCFAFFRLTQTISSQRRVESQHSHKTQLIKGIGWISVSLMLGGIETVIGFAVGGFRVVLTRRILRLLTRAFLCIGVIKGVDDQSHEIISNPRFSFFRQLSPKATSFHAAGQASNIHEESATYSTLPTPALPDMAHFANIRAENGRQRVAVQHHQDAPSLHLRSSALDLASPATIVQEIKSRPQSECGELAPPLPSYHQPFKSAFRDSSDSTSSFNAPFELVSAPRRMLSQRSARAQLYQAALPATSGEFLHPDSTTPSVVPTEALPIPQALGSPSELQVKGPSSHEGFVLSDDGE